MRACEEGIERAIATVCQEIHYSLRDRLNCDRTSVAASQPHLRSDVLNVPHGMLNDLPVRIMDQVTCGT